MIRAFIDSSVLIAGCLSLRGASYAILQASIRGNVTLVISDAVLAEIERNLAALPHRASEALDLFQHIRAAIPFELSNPTPQEVAEAAVYTFAKDAPIVAAAKRAGVDYLVSLDRKHLVGVPVVAEGSGLEILEPSALLAAIRQATAGGN